MAKLSALGHIGLAFETAYGTGVSPIVYVPYDTVKVEDTIKKVTDDARRGGTLAKDFNVYNATQSGSVELDLDAYPSLIGYFLKGILGQDVVTGSAVPYSHKFQIVNALAPSMTLQDNNAMTERQYKGAVMSELSMKFDTEDVLKMSAKFLSFASQIVTATTPTADLEKPFMGFGLMATLNGSSNQNVVGGEIAIKREAKLIFGANNTQNPTKAATARIDVTGKLTLDVEDETEMNLYLAGSQPALDLKFNLDANDSLDISFGKIDITKATVDRSQEFIRVDLEFRALYNTTDAGNVTITLKNSVATY